MAGITVECEVQDPHPLRLDPFSMVDGRLRWKGALTEEAMDEF